jgi:hypothetical protein
MTANRCMSQTPHAVLPHTQHMVMMVSTGAHLEVQHVQVLRLRVCPFPFNYDALLGQCTCETDALECMYDTSANMFKQDEPEH